MSKRFTTIFMAALTVSPMACASTTATVNRMDAATLYQQGTEKLAAHKWAEAVRLFERFTLEYPTDTRYQEARFRIGQAHFGAKEYVTAATEFGRLATEFPAGPYADDAQFNVCESYHRLSPDVELDQQYTQQAIDQCNVLVSYFQNSEFVPAAVNIIYALTDKLAQKMYNTGDYYFRRKVYDSAILYYDLTAKTYPGSSVAPRALQRMIDTYKVLGYATEEAATRARLLKDYPQAAAQKPDSVGKR